ncbi:MAG TPA: hypothetical protein VF091_02170 [Gaiellaceae bacterium]
MHESSESSRVWQVDLGNRSDLVFMLRDFLRRNAVDTTVSGPAALELTTAGRRDDLEALLVQWEAVTAVKAELRGRPKPITLTDHGMVGRPRLGELLVRRNFISEEQLTKSLNEARETGELLGVVLLKRQLIFEDELARTLSEQLSIPYISVMRVGVDAGVLNLMPAKEGHRVAAIPVREDGGEIQVAFADPTDREALDVVHQYIEHLRPAVSELSDIRMAWRQSRQFAQA